MDTAIAKGVDPVNPLSIHRIPTTRLRFLTTLLVVLVPWLLVPIASASTVKVLTLEELTARSSVVLSGTVKHVISVWATDGSDIFTYVTLGVERTLKGRVERPAAHTIRVRGGRVGGILSVVKGAPTFTRGEQVVLFLTPPDREGFPRVLGLAQGKWRIRDGKVLCCGRVDRRPGPVRLTTGSGKPALPMTSHGSVRPDRQDLVAFLRRVEAFVRASGPGR